MRFIATICGEEWSGRVIHNTGEVFDDYGPWKFAGIDAVRRQMAAWAQQDWDADARPENIEIEYATEDQ